jgi:cellulose synthase/poly-beta-1,6-N-acetylglucosamine synthase-like glycosyltransferase
MFPWVAVDLLAVYFGLDVLVNLVFLVVFLVVYRRPSPSIPQSTIVSRQSDDAGVAILVPAYNEAATVADSVRSLLALDYPKFEVIVINDGSKDATLEVLTREFKLQPEARDYVDLLGTAPVRAVYRSGLDVRLLVVDKPNSGKADSLNMGLALTEMPLVVTVDSDSLLAPSALGRLADLFRRRNAAAAGGLITAANGVQVKDGRVLASHLPHRALVLFQIIEYLVSYTVGRVAFSSTGALMILSGAFSMFDRRLLLDCGGFLTRRNHHPYVRRITRGRPVATVCEDVEVIVRLHRYVRENRLRRPIVFDPWPVAWTEVPSSLSQLARQRNRWHRGLLESLFLHRAMWFEPGYGAAGLLGMPYQLVYSAASPLLQLAGFGLLTWLVVAGQVSLWWLVGVLGATALAGGVITALVTTAVERRFARNSAVNLQAMRYHSFGDWLRLVVHAMVSGPVYGPLRSAFQLWGIWDWLAGRKSWYKFKREGFVGVKP